MQVTTNMSIYRWTRVVALVGYVHKN